MFNILDYINGGLDISMYIAIDFTASNGVPSDPKSKHYIDRINKRENAYEQAIRLSAEILLEYDSDKQVPVYGFGAKIMFPGYSSAISHCFPCNGIPSDFIKSSEVGSIDGIMGVYTYAINNIELNGPTYFEPVSRRVLKQVIDQQLKNEYSYSFLLLVTDGLNDDMREMIDFIVEASKHGLSIVIVGIGNENFDNMKKLDAGNLTSKLGANQERDICKFVPFE